VLHGTLYEELAMFHTWLTCGAGLLVAAGAVADGPPVTDGLRLWLAADRVDARDNKSVTAWANAAEGGPVKADGSESAPRWVADAGAGFPAVVFDGKSAESGGDVLRSTLVPADGATVFAVFRRDTQTDEGSINRPIVSSGTIGRGGRQQGLGLTVDREPSANRVRVEIADAPSSQDYGVNDGKFHVAAAVFDLDADTPSARLNLGGIALPTMAATVPAQPGPWTIGGGDDASLRGDIPNKRRFAGAIAEVLIYDRALSEDEVHAVGHYLNAKYDLGSRFWRAPAADAGPPSTDSAAAPFAVADGLFDFDAGPTLGLSDVSAQHVSVFAPGEADPKFNHQVKLFGFDGRLFAQWQTAARDEDAADSYVVWSASSDGLSWPAPQELAPPAEGRWIRTSGGWWSDGSSLTAFINYPSKPKMGRVTESRTLLPDDTWTPLADTIRGANIVGNPTACTSGGLVGVFLGSSEHDRKPGTVLMTTDDPTGQSGWTSAKFPRAETNRTRSARGVEPAIFKQADGDLVCIFRDMHGSGYSLASISHDQGQTWTMPVVTDMPDSGSMQSAGNLPDGTAYIINVPRPTTDLRVPLAITLSTDGEIFDRAFAVRTTVPEVWFEGKEKLQGYSYPHAWVWNDALWIAYATCKERIEVSRIGLAELTD
jgi:hypothetical protein